MNRSNSANRSIPTSNPYTRIEFKYGIDLLDPLDLLAGGQSTPDVGSRPLLSKPQIAGQPLPKRDTDCRCFDVAEVCEVLEIPADAVQACIRAGLLPVVEVGCRQLVTAGAVLAFVPERRRPEVRRRLDAVESRRGGRHG